MRLWHKNLIPVLPRQQLLGQWRECCLIAKQIATLGKPNHILVNKIMNYPMGHFWAYGNAVADEMENRGYACDFQKFQKWFNPNIMIPEMDEYFEDWHNDRYLIQCYYNLQEKFDCCSISELEWYAIEEYMEAIRPQN